ncbi:hypothetical protein [Streptomyces sp. Inha503]|uniref:hypothetical protein n=1 Tax=Streptomyces sp. Inha503 TaxID=3383314 RepID=UPI0039A0685A
MPASGAASAAGPGGAGRSARPVERQPRVRDRLDHDLRGRAADAPGATRSTGAADATRDGVGRVRPVGRTGAVLAAPALPARTTPAALTAAGGDPQVGDGVREHRDGRGGAARASGAAGSAGAAVHAVVTDAGRSGGPVRTRGPGRAAAIQRAAVAAVGLGDHDEGMARESGEDVLGIVDHLARDERQSRLGRQMCHSTGLATSTGAPAGASPAGAPRCRLTGLVDQSR